LKIKLLLVCLLALIISCASGPLRLRCASNFHKHLGGVTVALVFQNDSGVIRPYCTGVWISEDEILTAGHCAAGISRHIKNLEENDPVDPVGVNINYIVEDEVDQAGKVTGLHMGHIKFWTEDHDLALIKVDGITTPRHQIAHLVTSLPVPGDKVFCVGHPSGMFWTYVEGTVSAYRDIPDAHGKLIQINASVYFGNSGGGVFDENGDLLGIASFLIQQPNMAMYISVENINDFLKNQSK